MTTKQNTLIENIIELNRQREEIIREADGEYNEELSTRLQQIESSIKSPANVAAFDRLAPVATRLSVFAVSFWQFDEAPEVFQSLIHNDGDEDWLAYVPPQTAAKDPWTNRVLAIIDARKSYDYDVREILLPNGAKLFRGAHG